MRWLVLCWLLLWPITSYAQITVGDAIPAADVEQARATLEKATPKSLTLEVGEFEVIEPLEALEVTFTLCEGAIEGLFRLADLEFRRIGVGE